MASEIHVGDIGTQLIVAVYDDGDIVNISGALSKTIILKKPDDSVSNKSASLLTDGTDGKMVYTSVAGDFDQVGKYKIQGQVIFASGTFYTGIGSFSVNCNLGD